MGRTTMTAHGGSPGSPIVLDEWIARYGALWPAAALVTTLDACATVSRLDDRTVRRVIASLNTAGVTRCSSGWTWVPEPTESEGGPVSDHEIVERLGAILFCALSGETRVDLFAPESAWRTTLRESRPELATLIVDLTVGALSARRRRGLTPAVFAREIRHALGVERRAEPRMRPMSIAAVVAALLLFGAAWRSQSVSDRVGTNGLTTQESIRQDITYESATTCALVDEHTAALGFYGEWGRIWYDRLAPDDPRMIWTLAHQAWVRTLSGDRFTAEQLLDDAPDWLSRELGSHHPYARAARLALADTFAARGANELAKSLRNDAARAVRELFREFGHNVDPLEGVPAPPGVLSHVSPNLPEKEGFRAHKDGEYIAQLTSVQRLMAGRDGWRLHVAANGPCRTSVVVGNVPRRITLEAARVADGRWQVRIEGTKPDATLSGATGDSVAVSLVADGAGAVSARIGAETTRMTIDTSSEIAEPPYALTFDSDTTSGCAVVWLEIPFPFFPGAKLTGPPVSP